MLKQFKEFAIKGSMVDMAVGIIIGGAFATVVKSLVADILMPPIGLMLSGVDFSNMFIVLKSAQSDQVIHSLADAKEAGAVTLNYGSFFTAAISFIIVSMAVFFLVKQMNRLRRDNETVKESPTKECPHCFTGIHPEATRCPNCTSQLD